MVGALRTQLEDSCWGRRRRILKVVGCLPRSEECSSLLTTQRRMVADLGRKSEDGFWGRRWRFR